MTVFVDSQLLNGRGNSQSNSTAKIVCGVTWKCPQSGHRSHSLREKNSVLPKAHSEATRIQKDACSFSIYFSFRGLGSNSCYVDV